MGVGCLQSILHCKKIPCVMIIHHCICLKYDSIVFVCKYSMKGKVIFHFSRYSKIHAECGHFFGMENELTFP